METVMKGKILVGTLLMLVGTYASAAKMVSGNGISWTTDISGIGSSSGSITLNADTSGSTLGQEGFLGAVGIKGLGDPDSTPFRITSVSLSGWDSNDAEVNAASRCGSGSATSGMRQCAFAETDGDRVSSTLGNLSIVLGVEMDSGAIGDTFHFKVRWEDSGGGKIGDLISEDLSAVPIPAAAWLFASALTGLTIVARRRDRNRAAA